MKRLVLMSVVLPVALLLQGCWFDDQEDLRQWMAELRATTKPRVEPLAEPKQFVPQEYLAHNQMEPFDPMRLTQALRRESAKAAGDTSLITPELSRRKEPLEAYPLDAIKMVGSMNKNGVPTALVTVDKLLYQVRVGNYLGQSYGKIVAITESGMRLREIAQDPAGEWVERSTTLELQEGTEVKK